MIVIDETLISDNLHRIRFHCDLERCFGACCVEGDAGAPLEAEEIEKLKEALPDVMPFMQEEGIKYVQENGVFDFDPAGNLVTPLIHGKECAFVYFDGDIARCAIEKAFEEGLNTYRKPLSCHLYPVRIRSYTGSEAVNYHEWHVCHPALVKGRNDEVPLYIFLREPLIRKYGQAWYDRLLEEVKQKTD